MIKIGNIDVYGIIYKITNKVNGKVYIGQTIQDFNKRYHGRGNGIERVYNQHKSLKKNNRKYNIHLLSAFEKYGIENFDLIVNFDIAFSKDELNIKEQLWIKYFNSFKNGYNNCEGGASTKGHKHSKNSIILMSKNHIRQYGKDNYMYGRTHTKEAKEKISKTHKNKKLSPEHIEIIKQHSNGASNGNSKSIICLNTKETFDYMKLASQKYNVDNSDLTKFCKFKQKSYVKNEYGERIIFMYIEDYNYMIENKLSYEEIECLLKEKYNKKRSYHYGK